MKALSEQDEKTLKKVHEINRELLKAVDEICKKHGITYYLCWGALIGSFRHGDMIPWDNDVDVLITRSEFEKLLPYLYEELDPALYGVVMPRDYGPGRYFDCVPRVYYKKARVLGFPEGYNEFYKDTENRIALDFFFIDRFREGLFAEWTVKRLELVYGLLSGHRFSDEMSMEWPSFWLKAASRLLFSIGKRMDMERLLQKAEKLARKYEHDPKAMTYRVTNDTVHSFTYHLPVPYFDGTREVPLGPYRFPAPVEAEKVLTILYGDYMTPPPEEKQIPHIFNRVMTADVFEFDA